MACQFLSLLLLATTTVRAESTVDTNSIQSLKRMSLDDLMNVEITSVSKKEEKLSEAPAAVYVLTQDDIHRSGATSIPEALRLVPGLDVARIDAHTWAISSRGFNGEFANKLLVLIDGRSVYTPLFSGVFWDVQDPMLEDVDRIEVIRGPGAALWGANAVNGVINIITKSAKDTQGWLFSGGGGNQDRGFGEFRYGGSRGDDLFYRLYGTYFDHADSEMLGGGNGRDGWQQGRGGFRVDWQPSRDNLLTVQGDAYDGTEGQVFGVPTLTSPYAQQLTQATGVSGGDVLGRWTHTLANGAEVKLQTYYDKTVRDTAILGDNLTTFDIDLQYDQHFGSRQEVIAGLGYRLEDEAIRNSSTVMFNPNHTDRQLFSGFVQDEVTLIPDRLKLTLGTKLEHNDFTGFEVEPSGRISWTPTIHQTVWAAVSRAVRTPSEEERDSRTELQAIPPGGLYPGSPPALVTAEGDNAFASEDLLAYELGYRVRPCERVSLDFATFYNDYSRLGYLRDRRARRGDSAELSGGSRDHRKRFIRPNLRTRGRRQLADARLVAVAGHVHLASRAASRRRRSHHEPGNPAGREPTTAVLSAFIDGFAPSGPVGRHATVRGQADHLASIQYHRPACAPVFLTRSAAGMEAEEGP